MVRPNRLSQRRARALELWYVCSVPSPLIHIGYHKTASSWLQRRVFPNAPSLHYAAGPHEPGSPLRNLFFETNSFDYDPDKARKFLEPRIKDPGDRVPVISHERFSGGPYSGGHDSKLTAHRLHEIFPDARILLVIREQSDMLLSMYKQYIQAGGGASFSQFITPRTGAGSIASFRLDYLEYHRLIGCYQRLFGADDVLVLPYEILRRDPADFLSRIGAFLDADLGPPDSGLQKPSLSAAALCAARHGNRLFAFTGLNPAPIFARPNGQKAVKRFSRKLDTKLPTFLKEATDRRWRRFAESVVSDCYAESNSVTQELIGLDLKRHGYAVC